MAEEILVQIVDRLAFITVSDLEIIVDAVAVRGEDVRDSQPYRKSLNAAVESGVAPVIVSHCQHSVILTFCRHRDFRSLAWEGDVISVELPEII